MAIYGRGEDSVNPIVVLDSGQALSWELKKGFRGYVKCDSSSVDSISNTDPRW